MLHSEGRQFPLNGGQSSALDLTESSHSGRQFRQKVIASLRRLSFGPKCASRLSLRASYIALVLVSLLLRTVVCRAQSAAQILDREAILNQVHVYAQAHRLDEALQIILPLVKQNPRDFEARNWVARLQGWKGHFKDSEELYRKVLADHPRDPEAELGLADVLSWQKEFEPALDILRELDKQQPNDPEVLIRLGRLSMWQHQRSDSIRYFKRVLQTDPNNTEARDAMRNMEREEPFRLETGYLFEGYDFTRNTNGSFVQLVYRDYDRKTLLGGFQYQNKFGENDTLFTLGATYRVLHRTYLRGEMTVGPRSQAVVPNQDYTVELTQGLPHGVAIGGAFRYMNFATADVQVPTGILDWDVKPTLHLVLRYTPAGTFFRGVPGRAWNQGGWVRSVWDANRRFSPYLLFATGAESFEGAVSSEQLGRFIAHTYGAGMEIHLSLKQGLRLGYFYQKRTSGRKEQSVGASYYFSF